MTNIDMENVFRISKQASVLPAGYEKLEYIETTGTQYIDTGIIPTRANSTEVRVKLVETEVFTTNNGFGSDSNLNAVNTSTYWRLNGKVTETLRQVGTVCNITLKHTSQGRYYNVNGEEGYGTGSERVSNFLIGQLGGFSNYSLKAKWYSCEMLENDTLVRSFIPAKRTSDNAIGMYDLVTNIFFPNAGTGSFTAGPAVEVTKISQNNNVIWERAIPLTSNKDDEITFRSTRNKSKNLINLATVTDGYYYDANGNYLSSAQARLTDFISAKSSESYTWVGAVTGGNLNLRISYFDSNKNFISQDVRAITSTTAINIQITSPSNTQYIRISGNYIGTNRFIWENMMFVEGSVAPTTYQPYWNTLPELNAYGKTEQRTQEKLWGRYVPIQTLSPSTYPMKDSEGRIAVQDIGLDGTQTGVYGYYNEATNTFTQVSGMTGSALEQISYIEGTGSQYILPNLTGNVRWKIVAEGTKQNAQQVLASSSQSGADGTWIGEIGSTGKWGIGDNVASTVDVSTKAELEIDFTSTTQNGMINGELIAHPSSAVHNTWALMGTSTGNYCFNGKLFSAQAIQNNVIVRDYIPIKAGAVYCLLDKVNWEIVGSASGTGFNGSSAVIVPDDIVCNNGVIKYGYKDINANLPTGYERLEYIADDINNGTKTVIIDTGIAGNNDNLEFEFEAYYDTYELYGRFFGNYVADASNGWRIILASQNQALFNANKSCSGGDTFGLLKDQWNHVIFNKTFATINDNAYSVRHTREGATNNANISIFSFLSSTNHRYIGLRCKYFIIRDNGVLVRTFIPAKRNSDNVVGMYDLVTNTFITNAGTGSFTAGNVIQRELYTEGTQEKITVSGKNLFDKSKAVLGDISATTGEPVSTFTYRFVSDFIKVNEGDTISFSGKMMYVGYSDEYDCSFIKAFYDSNKNFISGSRLTANTPLTIPTGVSYVRIEGYNTTMASGHTVDLDSIKVMIVKGSTVATYEPYHAPQTALAEMLNKVGTYTDIQEISTGAVTKNVGIKVLDGTESWGEYTYGGSPLSFQISINDMIETASSTSSTNFSNTHFQWVSVLWGKSDIGYAVSTMKRMFFRRNTTDTLDTWKAYLASEYANGTPVIVLYPLATSTTQTTTPQAININKGTYKAITEGSLSDLQIDAKYLGND